MFEHLGKTGFKTCVFEKHFISYSCILFTKFNALRSFCNILLCFSKILFPENLGLTLCISIDRIYFLINRKCNENFLAWFCVFQSIETNFQSIENRIRVFKTLSFSRVLHYSNFFKTLSLSIRSVQGSKQVFVVFNQISSRVFFFIHR